jgi:ABC-type phosphate/phosphonate transport system ATPase subunit
VKQKITVLGIHQRLYRILVDVSFAEILYTERFHEFLLLTSNTKSLMAERMLQSSGMRDKIYQRASPARVNSPLAAAAPSFSNW